jgi:hypothetical protein
MTSKRLWVLEGPDGGGKSTLAVDLAARTGADVVHCGPFPQVHHGLGRLYVEAMLPALLGHRDVILDRSWLSEPIYAAARRHERSRLSPVELRMLERVAARCQTTVVRCRPPLATCLDAYRARKPIEYLRDEAQLAAVWHLYDKLATGLPTVDYDYTNTVVDTVAYLLDGRAPSTAAHQLGVASAGYLDAPVLLVGEAFAAHKEQDPLYQAPFVSFGAGGCSRWLTAQLERAGVPERQLLWVNADQNLVAVFFNARPKVVVALGEAAAMAVAAAAPAGVKVVQVAHPQHAKRFHHCAPYELITVLKEALS